MLAALAVLALVLEPARSPAQEAARVEPGDRVRVRTTDSVDAVGTVAALRADTLTLRTAGSGPELALPITEIQRLEVSRGTSSRALPGAAGGALAGGFIAGVTFECERGSDLCGLAHAGVIVGGAVVGGLLGLMLGSAVRTEGWEVVPIEAIRARPGSRRASALEPSVSIPIGGAEP